MLIDVRDSTLVDLNNKDSNMITSIKTIFCELCFSLYWFLILSVALLDKGVCSHILSHWWYLFLTRLSALTQFFFPSIAETSADFTI